MIWPTVVRPYIDATFTLTSHCNFSKIVVFKTLILESSYCIRRAKENDGTDSCTFTKGASRTRNGM